MHTSLQAEIGKARLQWVSHLAVDAGWHFKAHSHQVHELIVIHNGGLIVEHEGQRTDAGAGDVLLYPAGMIHAERANPLCPPAYHFLQFACGGLGHALIREVDERSRIRQMIGWLDADRDASTLVVQTERDALLHAILAEFVRGSGAEDRPAILRVRRHIREHIAEPLRLSDLAKAAEMSKFHFLRTYRAATGRTPMQDVRAMRANYARELILGTNLPLKDIAPRAGLGNEYAMSRIFRQIFQMPPGQYRRFHHCRT